MTIQELNKLTEVLMSEGHGEKEVYIADEYDDCETFSIIENNYFTNYAKSAKSNTYVRTKSNFYFEEPVDIIVIPTEGYSELMRRDI